MIYRIHRIARNRMNPVDTINPASPVNPVKKKRHRIYGIQHLGFRHVAPEKAQETEDPNSRASSRPPARRQEKGRAEKGVPEEGGERPPVMRTWSLLD